MSTAVDMRLADDPRYATIVRLRREIHARENLVAHSPVLELGTVLSPLFPDGGLRVGASYRISHTPALFSAIVAEATKQGVRCVVLGMPTLGLEFTRRLGADLEHLILIPRPGRRLVDIVSAVSEVVPLVLCATPTRVSEKEAARLASRFRDRACTFLTTGTWSPAYASIECRDPRPVGIGKGWGAITEQAVTVTVHNRTGERRTAAVLLPGRSGTLEAAPAGVAEVHTFPQRMAASR